MTICFFFAEPPIRVGQQYCFACPNGRPTSNDCNTIKLCEDDQVMQPKTEEAIGK